jgi:hypothetical protein
VKFAYTHLAVGPTAAVKVRYRPLAPIHILAPQTLPPLDACIDCAADDTVFPPRWAARLGVNLQSLPKAQGQSVGGSIVQMCFAQVTMCLSDGHETCQWDTTVGFLTKPMRWALLGQSGFLEFFDVQLLGARREAVIVPNASFKGQHFIVGKPGP